MKERPLSGDSIAINRRYLDSLLAESRIVGAVHPATDLTLFGRHFGTPIASSSPCLSWSATSAPRICPS